MRKNTSYFDEDDFEDYDDYYDEDEDYSYHQQQPQPKKNQSSSSIKNQSSNKKKNNNSNNNNSNNQKTKSSISRKTQNIQIREKDQKLLESLLQEKNPTQSSPNNLSSQQRSKLYSQLSKLGFKDKDIQRSFPFCSDVNQAVEWLLINVDEKDLPEAYLQKKGD